MKEQCLQYNDQCHLVMDLKLSVDQFHLNVHLSTLGIKSMSLG